MPPETQSNLTTPAGPTAESRPAHTRGPWQRHYSSSWPDEWVIGGEGFAPVIAFVTRDKEDDMPGATVEANARLIAAAPDLLAALKTMLNPDHDNDAGNERDIDMAMAAIRKAEGRAE